MKSLVSFLLICFAINAYAEDLFTLQTAKVNAPYFDEDSDHTATIIRGGILSEKGLAQHAQQLSIGSESAVMYSFEPYEYDPSMLSSAEIRFNIQPAVEDIGKVADVVITATFIDLKSAIKGTLDAYKNGATEGTVTSSLISTHTTSFPGLMGYVITPTQIIPTGDQASESLYPAQFVPFSTLTLQENQDVVVYRGNLSALSGALTLMCYYKVQGEEALTYSREPIALLVADQEMVANIIQQELAKMDAAESLNVLINMLGQDEALSMFGLSDLGDIGGLGSLMGLLGGMGSSSLFNTDMLDF